MIDLGQKEKADIDFYRDNADESPEADSLWNLLNKMGDCGSFVEAIKPFDTIFKQSKRVVEIGGGQGWASAVLKKIYPHIEIVLTDISEHAVVSRGKWENIFHTKIDRAYACRSYQTEEQPGSIDLVFCFSSAHHFIKHRKSLQEFHRILRPGGACLYLHEPSTSRLLYPIAYRRVNKIRSVVVEDVLIHSGIKKLAAEVGLDCTLHFFPSTNKRGPLETVYYYLLGKIPFIKKVLPCTVNYHFRKP